MLQRTGEAETITTHYLFALGGYRALYLVNWIYRYINEGHVDWVAWVAGIVQTLLYSDFFYIYYTRYIDIWKNLEKTRISSSSSCSILQSSQRTQIRIAKVSVLAISNVTLPVILIELSSSGRMV